LLYIILFITFIEIIKRSKHSYLRIHYINYYLKQGGVGMSDGMQLFIIFIFVIVMFSILNFL